MATAKEDIKSLETLFECAICMDKYKDARYLQCGHHFCRKCLQGVLEQQVGPTIPCPTCRCETALSPGQGVSDLPRPVLLNEIQEKISSFLQTPPAAEDVRTCDICVGKHTPATYFCVECDQKFCDPCKLAHNQVDGIDGHSAMSLALFCDIHPKKKVVLHCQDCNTCICAICVMAGHKEHTKHPLAKAAEASRGRLNEVIETGEGLEYEKEIVKSVKSILQLTQDRRQAFIKDTASIRQCLRELPRILDKEVRSTEKNFENSIDKITACLSDADCLISSKKALIHRAEHLVTEEAEPKLVVQEHAFPSFESSQSVADICGQQISIPEISDFHQFALKLTTGQMTFETIKAQTTPMKGFGRSPEMAKLMTVGTSVKGVMSMGFILLLGGIARNIDGKIGTVINASEAGFRTVKWNDGKQDKCSMGADNAYQLILV